MHHPTQDSTYHSLCYTHRGALAGTRNSSMGPPHEGSIRRPIAPWANALTTELHLAPVYQWLHWYRTWFYVKCLMAQCQSCMPVTAWITRPHNHQRWPKREREREVLFNDALNTFYLRLYGVRHMVKDHSDSERGNPHRLLLSINS